MSFREYLTKLTIYSKRMHFETNLLVYILKDVCYFSKSKANLGIL